ncbi:unnamed protein product [Mesocestoides corti]|uniref:Uncharacterized protein n=1 Tax=Mesocestoides corti TaxID=53468 RepID=A0A0R3UB60_MESCO|nr:unnamed protein product [Mesocestoides corti]
MADIHDQVRRDYPGTTHENITVASYPEISVRLANLNNCVKLSSQARPRSASSSTNQKSADGDVDGVQLTQPELASTAMSKRMEH